MNGSVTITLSKQDNPTFVKGQLIRIGGKKRIWGEIFKTDGYSHLSISPIYRPAPKSKLLNKSVFSKVKSKIIPLTTAQR